jgi:hypothetical protein
MNEPLKKHLCVCGHEETYHKEGDGYCFGFSCRNGVGCIAFRPAPSQPSRTGFELDNGTSGTVANTHYPPEVRDEKIARIIKEFDKKFHKMTVEWDETEKIYRWPQKQVGAWLTQTLTTLLNEE